MYKELKNVNLKKERAFLHTALGSYEIIEINRVDWWVYCGDPYNGRGFSCTPNRTVQVIER